MPSVDVFEVSGSQPEPLIAIGVDVGSAEEASEVSSQDSVVEHFNNQLLAGHQWRRAENLQELHVVSHPVVRVLLQNGTVGVQQIHISNDQLPIVDRDGLSRFENSNVDPDLSVEHEISLMDVGSYRQIVVQGNRVVRQTKIYRV